MSRLSNMLLALMALFLVGCSDVTLWGGDTITEYAGDIHVEHFIQPQTTNGVDILWVLDFSGSMGSYQEQVINGIEQMMNGLPESGWRFNMISADWRDAESEAQFPLVPGDSVQDAWDMYEAISHREREAGLEASYTYIEDNPEASFWMRDEATLLTVFVSDEPDQSTRILPDEWIEWYEDLRGTGTTFVAGIHRLDNYPGYDVVLDHFNGTTVDISSTDWTPGVQQATEQVEPFDSWPTVYEPVVDSMVVFQDGTQSFDWSWDGVSVVFDVIPEPGVLVEIAYVIEGSQLLQ